MSQDLRTWNRQTYSILDWIGDLGGLLDGLKYLCALIISPFSKFWAQSILLTNIFKLRTGITEEDRSRILQASDLS